MAKWKEKKKGSLIEGTANKFNRFTPERESFIALLRVYPKTILWQANGKVLFFCEEESEERLVVA